MPSLQVRQDVRRAHCNLGHCSRAVLLRSMRASKISPAHIAWTKRWVCQLCAARAAPGMIKPAGLPHRSLKFGHSIAIDLRQEVDTEGSRVNVLDILCLGTRFSMYVAIPSKSPHEVAESLFMFWCSVAGVPEVIVHDQGGEFQTEVVTLGEHWGSRPRVGAAEAPLATGVGRAPRRRAGRHCPHGH